MAADGSGAPRRRRLSRSGDFKRAYREGTSRASRLLVIYRFGDSSSAVDESGASDDDSQAGPNSSRLGVSVSRKIGDSVTRNRVKRVLKEAFWQAFAADVPGDVVIVARPGIEKVIEERGLDGAVDAMAELLGTSGDGEDGPRPSTESAEERST